MSQRVFVRNLGGTPIVLDVAESSDGVTDGDKGDITVSGGGTVWTIDSDVIREKLTVARTYYVRTDGSDTNTGLANTAGGAFLTIQKGIDAVCALDCNIYDATVEVADGTYSVTGIAVQLKPVLGSGTYTLKGNYTTPSNVVISATSGHAIYCVQAIWSIGGFKITTTTSGQGLFLNNYSAITLSGKMDYGTVVSFHNLVQNQSYLDISGIAYTISGNAGAHWYGDTSSVINNQIGGTIITLTGTPAFSYNFAVAAANASLAVSVLVFQNASGKTRQAATGDTHSNTTLDNISINTSLLSTGMAIIGTNIPAGTTISSISSATAVVMSAAATDTAVGKTLAFEIATGKRYLAQNNGVISVAGASVNYLPGSVAGTGTNSGTTPFGLYT